MLGAARAADLAVNIILPWFWIRATLGGNDQLKEEAWRRFRLWPASQDNGVLRLARTRLFGGAHGDRRWTAAEQQGLLQVVHDFCGHSNALCDACVMPARLAELWAANKVVEID
jgi:hypothetical protein